MPVSRDDVVQCYFIIMHRALESEVDIQRYVASCSSIWELMSAIFRSYEFQDYRCDPRTLFHKPAYLARNFSQKQKSECYFYNFNFLCENTSSEGYAAITDADPIIYETCPENTLYQVVACSSREYSHEGGISLWFHANGRQLYVISFSIVPGRVVNLSDKSAILISRLQGRPGQSEFIRRATKEMGDISPQIILFSAVQGVARSFGIDCILGIEGVNHVSYQPAWDAAFRQGYDDFFKARGVDVAEGGFFRLRLSEGEDSTRAAKPGRRRRTDHRRQVRAEVARSVQTLWEHMFLPEDRPYAVAKTSRATAGETFNSL